MLTPRQKQVKDFVNKTILKKGIAPTEREIARRFKISPSTAHGHLMVLQEKGYLEKAPGRARGIKIASAFKLVKIPILGTIAAGQPIEAIQDKETIAVPKSKIPPSSEVYALRVAGNSMVDEKINDGDIILVKQQDTAENGQKVVALIGNREATLKKFFKERGHIRLQPANKNMAPFIFKNGRDVAIQGIALDVIREENTPTIQFPEYKRPEQYKELPLNKIICGDAITELKKLPDNSCDAVISDPPYNIGKDFGNNLDKRELNEYISWCKEWINECIRVMKPTGTMFIYGFSEILAHLSVEIPISKRWLIWHYTNKNVASLNFWKRSHEAIICAWKGKPIFNKDAVREPYTEGFLNGAAGKVRKGTLGRFSKNGMETIYKAHEDGALPRDVIKVPALAGGAGMIERWFLCKTCDNVFEPRQLQKHSGHDIIKHPTQKPLELSRKLIRSAMPKKDGVVLVPFVGTGSECIAAKELGQVYIGFEINPDYVKIAENWLKATKPVLKLL